MTPPLIKGPPQILRRAFYGYDGMPPVCGESPGVLPYLIKWTVF